MEKLRLDLDAIAVESFDVHDVRDERGTVLGNDFISGRRCSAIDACPSARGCTEISPC